MKKRPGSEEYPTIQYLRVQQGQQARGWAAGRPASGATCLNPSNHSPPIATHSCPSKTNFSVHQNLSNTYVMTQNSVVCTTCTGTTVIVLAANQAPGLYMPCPVSRRSSRRSLSQATVAV